MKWQAFVELILESRPESLMLLIEGLKQTCLAKVAVEVLQLWLHLGLRHGVLLHLHVHIALIFHTLAAEAKVSSLSLLGVKG